MCIRDRFQHHVKRFGADHSSYNAVMQACAFAGQVERCQQLFDEMVQIHLIPNAQSYVNMMLARKLAGEPREKLEAIFKEGVRTGALTAVMRLDTEFTMWYDMLTRLGSFKGNQGVAAKDPETMTRLSAAHSVPQGGYLSSPEGDSKPMPSDMWATWGWDSTLERKFVPRSERVKYEVDRRLGGGRAVSYTHLRAHETPEHLVCRLLLEKKKKSIQNELMSEVNIRKKANKSFTIIVS
eukprot:TRINITY_DN60682_c0_g1_i1.p1 TRINITY_DN60682_c0_g1~~TRINITY_DN60682_c0_g1_i1.p1  ORF type:complete len:238 (-),score=41.60 TRINITY_DN60682_c0_g1_i1:52-765(-)